MSNTPRTPQQQAAYDRVMGDARTVAAQQAAGVIVHPADAAPIPPKRTPRAIGYVVLPYGGYPDTASDYVACSTRADVEEQLTDYGWMDNPGVHVYKVMSGETANSVIAELSGNPDPYPDYVVERGARGGIAWSLA